MTEYEERQAEWVREYNIEEGTELILTRAATSFEDGWADTWVDEMDTIPLGSVVRFRSRNFDKGINIFDSHLNWPFFVFDVLGANKKMPEPSIDLSISLHGE